MTETYQKVLEQSGFAIVQNLILPPALNSLIDELAEIENIQAVIRRKGVTYGIRNLLSLSHSVQNLAKSEEVLSLVKPLIGSAAFPVRAIFFDKTPSTNWGVAWHQDLAIPVRQKIRVDGFGPWSVKAGVPHTYAPASVLEKMLTIRLHIDDVVQANGALRVLPGSHLYGRLTDKDIEEWQRAKEPVVCEVLKGGVVAMNCRADLNGLVLELNVESEMHHIAVLDDIFFSF